MSPLGIKDEIASRIHLEICKEVLVIADAELSAAHGIQYMKFACRRTRSDAHKASGGSDRETVGNG